MITRATTRWLAVIGIQIAGVLLSATSLLAEERDLRCSALASLQRFTVIASKDSDRRDLYLGADVTVGTTDVAGTCATSSGTCECPKLRCAEEGEACSSDRPCPDGTCSLGVCVCAAVACDIGGQRCAGDGDCLTAAPGLCDEATRTCRCPRRALGCLARGRSCVDGRDCQAPTSRLGSSPGGVCGNDMLITAGSRVGLLATRGDVDFGSSQAKCRELRIEVEYARTASGRFEALRHAPLLGPASAAGASGDPCSCKDGCGGGFPLLQSSGSQPFTSANGQAHRGLSGSGSSLNFKLCDTALTLLESSDGGQSFETSPFQKAIESFQPLAEQRVRLGAANCLACARASTSDEDCFSCSPRDILQTRSTSKKIVLILAGGLQVLDVEHLALQGNTVLEIRGQRDSVVLIRVARGLRVGAKAKITLESNNTGHGTLQVDKVLWVANGIDGNRPNLSRSSTFRGTLLASGRSGIRVGGKVLVEGALWSRRVSLGVQTTVQHYPFSELLPLPGSASEIFVPTGNDSSSCLARLS